MDGTAPIKSSNKNQIISDANIDKGEAQASSHCTRTDAATVSAVSDCERNASENDVSALTKRRIDDSLFGASTSNGPNFVISD